MKYIKDRISEIHNVTWPTRKQAIHSMILVLTIMLITGLFLGFVDNIFALATDWVFNIVK